MSVAIDNFTQQLHDNLEAIETRTNQFRDNIQAAPKKTQAEIQLKLDEAKEALDAKKNEFDAYRAKLQTQFDEKEADVMSTVEQWKTSREVKKLSHRADKAENYATTSTFLAMAMMQEAEKATLEAIAARLDADVAMEPARK
jgi:Mg2+ and Co2+ transporter CorA